MKQYRQERNGRSWTLLMVLAALVLVAQRPGPAAGAEENRPVAKVFQELVGSDDLEPSPESYYRYRLNLGDELVDVWARNHRRSVLRDLILNKLVRDFARDQKVAGSDEEIEGYLAYLRRIIGERQATLARERETLALRLQGSALDEELRQHLQDRIGQIDLASRRFDETFSGEAGGGDESGPPGGARWTIAREAVEAWKLDKALFERYGGEVVGKGWRLIPVGALRALVEDRLASLDITFLDPDYCDLFDDDTQLIPASHPYAVTRRQAEAYYSQPWWQRFTSEALPSGAELQP